MKTSLLILAGLLACGTASGESLDYKQVRKKRPPPDPAAVWPQHWYVGGGVQHAETRDWSVSRQTEDGSFQSIDADDEDQGYSLYGGVAFERTISFALELGYIDFGGTSQTIQSDGSGGVWAAGPIREKQQLEGTLFSVLGGYPVGRGFSLFARLGALRWRSEFEYRGTTRFGASVRHRGSHSHVDLAYGAGVRYDASGAWQLRASYTGYPLSDSDLDVFEASAEAVDLSLAYRFGK